MKTAEKTPQIEQKKIEEKKLKPFDLVILKETMEKNAALMTAAEILKRAEDGEEVMKALQGMSNDLEESLEMGSDHKDA